MNIFGKLTIEALPHDPIVIAASIFMALGAVGIFGLLTYLKKWTWLWKEWLTTVDHKKIGIMYLIVAFVMLLRGFSDALLMRSHQAIAYGVNTGYLPPDHYDQIFTAHGVIMIFFVAMPFLFGLLNFVVPLQIGARDVAFPFLNSLSFWFLVSGAVLMNASLVIGEFARTGWLAYPPLSGIDYSPGVGVDYYIWAIQISGIGTLISGINFFVTIIKMRCPGMTLMRMPIFTWSALCSMVLVIAAFPVLTATLGMLALDRILDMNFFTSGKGGNVMMYINLIWIWGHPEVYILILPAFGIFSEIVAVYARKKLFGYVTMVWALSAIMVLSFMVWLHHFFTMGSGANVNAFFGIATMIISIPTGVKIFNWLFTLYQGRIKFDTPLMWTLGFMITFTVGGMTGVILSIPGVNFQIHNSVFVIAHFHNTIIGGVLFGYFAGFSYWFPKMFGFKLNEKLGKCAFWCWNIGFYVAFVPLYILGFMGMTRRLSYYQNPDWQPFLIIAAFGGLIIAAGIGFQILQLIISIKDRNKNRDTTGDPWDGRTLEWSTSSPPPFYNFALEPEVKQVDDFWYKKEAGISKIKKKYEEIHMPKNTSIGLIVGLLSLPLSFGIVWHIWWLVALMFIAIIITLICHSFNYDTDYYVTVKEIEKEEKKRNLYI
jgi:cytochrome o ubiquinol oxidase subunit 1